MRRGSFVVETRREESVLTANEVWPLVPGTRYRIRHPFRGGDECTVLRISAALRDEYPALQHHRRPTLTSNDVFRLQLRLRTAARSGGSALDIEETTRGILEAAFPARRTPRPTAAHLRLVRAAQQLIASRYADRLTLNEIAASVDSSAYHLARVFRNATGETLHRYQTKLRLRAAIERLSRGERDLATLAFDLGFCDQSHFTNSFRRAFGIPPSRI